MKISKKAFTLVELIVVITILAILATIGFVSFSGYLAGTRDTNRISQIKSMSDALTLYQTRKNLPIPDDKIEIKIGTRLIGYQGYIGANVLETIEYTEKGLDPKDKTYFSYYLTKNKKYAQLLSFLEEANEDVIASNFSTAKAIDYSGRTPKVTGMKLGILLDEEKTPIQEVESITSSGYLDIGNLGTTFYSAVVDDEDIISGTGYTILASTPEASCRRLKQIKGSLQDGFYRVDPYGDGVGYKAYCNFDFKYTTFDSFIEDGGMENPKSLNWSDGTKVTDDANSGNSALKFMGHTYPRSQHFTYVKPGKRYKLEGWFKSKGSEQSRLYFGFREYDENFVEIVNSHVNAKPGTETTLSSNVVPSDTSIHFNCDTPLYDKWRNQIVYHSLIAFEVDDSGEYNDLPNRKLSGYISNKFNQSNLDSLITKSGNICSFNYHLLTGGTAGVTYPAGTKIRLHSSGGTVNYIGASNATVPTTWKQYQGEVLGPSKSGVNQSYFRRGTRFVKIHMLANYQQNSDAVLYVDDLKLLEY